MLARAMSFVSRFRRLARSLRLHGSMEQEILPICAVCSAVRINGIWGDYKPERDDGKQQSHSLCPVDFEKAMEEVRGFHYPSQ